LYDKWFYYFRDKKRTKIHFFAETSKEGVKNRMIAFKKCLTEA